MSRIVAHRVFALSQIKLMDSNIALDQTMGSVEYDVVQLPLNETVKKTFFFNEVSPTFR